MTDQFGRRINYMRISVTDRCNLRCRYCMPEDLPPAEQENMLRFEELLRVCAAAVELGITRFKITGGEPLVRPGCADFIARLKELPGVEQVTLTTNGLLLAEDLDALCAANLDGVNISLDALDEALFRQISGGRGSAAQVLSALRQSVERGLKAKINTVILEENAGQAESLAALAGELPVDVRFIELMPIGFGAALNRASPDELLERLKRRWPDLEPTDEKRGNGPAHYYKSAALQGRIGFIDAVSHKFCQSCNRVRLTSTGLLKPCLCYDEATDLRALLRSGGGDAELRRAMEERIYNKPRAHSFDSPWDITEKKAMSQIGG